MTSSFLSFLFWPLLPTRGRCRGLLLHMITFSDTRTHTHTFGRTPLTRDRPVVETSTWRHTTFKGDSHAPAHIRTRNPSKRTAADPRLKPRGQWDKLVFKTWGLVKPYDSSDLPLHRKFSDLLIQLHAETFRKSLYCVLLVTKNWRYITVVWNLALS